MLTYLGVVHSFPSLTQNKETNYGDRKKKLRGKKERQDRKLKADHYSTLFAILITTRFISDKTRLNLSRVRCVLISY